MIHEHFPCRARHCGVQHPPKKKKEEMCHPEEEVPFLIKIMLFKNSSMKLESFISPPSRAPSTQ